MLPPAHPVSTQVLHFVLDYCPVISTLSSAVCRSVCYAAGVASRDGRACRNVRYDIYWYS